MPHPLIDVIRLREVVQVNGDYRIDDADDGAPMISLQFHKGFADWPADRKARLMRALWLELAAIFAEMSAP